MARRSIGWSCGSGDAPLEVIRGKWPGIVRALPGSAVMAAPGVSAIPFRHEWAHLGRRDIIVDASPAPRTRDDEEVNHDQHVGYGQTDQLADVEGNPRLRGGGESRQMRCFPR